ncbi:MAG: hypothetical protein ACXVCY_16900 [Pseudobdellovibrionaceae bacterium]
MLKILVFISMALSASSIYAQSLPIGTSLIQNGGFELGANLWDFNSPNVTLNSATPLFGSQSMRLGASPCRGGQGITSGIEPGAKYRVSGYATVAAATDLATLGVEFKNSAGENILDQWIEIYGNTLKLYSFDVRVPYGTTSIQVYGFKNFGDQPVDLDNIDFVKIAGP